MILIGKEVDVGGYVEAKALQIGVVLVEEDRIFDVNKLIKKLPEDVNQLK